MDYESKNGSDKPSLNTKPLEKIVNKHANARDKPVMVIAVGGVARSGKSFLLNLFVSYLSYIEKVKPSYFASNRCCKTTTGVDYEYVAVHGVKGI